MNYDEHPIVAHTGFEKQQKSHQIMKLLVRVLFVLMILISLFSIYTSITTRSFRLDYFQLILLCVVVNLNFMSTLIRAEDDEILYKDGQTIYFRKRDFVVIVETEGVSIQCIIKYSMIRRAVETSDSFVLYIGREKKITVSKQGFQTGSAAELHLLLRAAIPPKDSKKR